MQLANWRADNFQQFVLGYDAVVMRDQCLQHIYGTSNQFNGSAVNQQRTFGGAHLDIARPVTTPPLLLPVWLAVRSG